MNLKQNYDWGENQIDANCSTVNQPEWDSPATSWFDKQSLFKRAINLIEEQRIGVWSKKKKKENADSI